MDCWSVIKNNIYEDYITIFVLTKQLMWDHCDKIQNTKDTWSALLKEHNLFLGKKTTRKILSFYWATGIWVIFVCFNILHSPMYDSEQNYYNNGSPSSSACYVPGPVVSLFSLCTALGESCCYCLISKVKELRLKK